MMPPLLSLSLLVSSSSLTATALTDAMSDSVLFFFCSDFREDIFVDLNWKRFWPRWDLNPLPSDLIHDKLDHRTTVSSSVSDSLKFEHFSNLLLQNGYIIYSKEALSWIFIESSSASETNSHDQINMTRIRVRTWPKFFHNDKPQQSNMTEKYDNNKL